MYILIICWSLAFILSIDANVEMDIALRGWVHAVNWSCAKVHCHERAFVFQAKYVLMLRTVRLSLLLQKKKKSRYLRS